MPLRIGLEADEEFGVEEAGRVGAVVGPAMFRADHGDLGEGGDNRADLRHDLRRFIERDRVGHGRPDPQGAFVQMWHELRAYVRRDKQSSSKKGRGNGNGALRPCKAAIETADIDGPNPLEDLVASLADAAPH